MPNWWARGDIEVRKWSYLPHTDGDRQKMLETIGVSSVEDLFADIPATVRMKRKLNLPPALSEKELKDHFQELTKRGRAQEQTISFLGAGAYDHYIPSTVSHLMNRSEFLTAYTQYQPEIAQGYLQALWEYQSLICLLTGMEIAVTSLYDGATALAEAMMMACGITGRNDVLVSKTVHPHWREVLETYARDRDISIRYLDYSDGVTAREDLNGINVEGTAAIICQTPNFLGGVEDLRMLADAAHSGGALLIAAVNPISLGVLEAPGAQEVDIVVGEAQPLGLPLSFGGPYIGFMATREKWLRRTPGRIVGQTVDQQGTRGFVLTIQAREQHIRREKATSNICSNEALCSLAVAIYLSTLGREGVIQVADLCLQKAHYTLNEVVSIPGFRRQFASPFFNEFVVSCPQPPAQIRAKLRESGILAGLDLGQYYPELSQCLLIAVTENRTRAQIDNYVSLLRRALS